MPYKHIPVMLSQTVDYLNCKPGKIYVDCTLGGSGHARAICEKIVPDGILIGIDQDPDAINNAKKVLKQFEQNIRLFQKNYIYLPEVLRQSDIDFVDGILLDLGISLHQLESSGRGFSFKKDEPLDMRMNPASGPKAEDLVNRMNKSELKKIFQKYGEERQAGRIAEKIVLQRRQKPIKTSAQLAGIVCDAKFITRFDKHRIHPATKVFMSLRIAVNKELENLEQFMKGISDLLNPGGRLCVISFHSLEDRIVKQGMKYMEKACECPPDFPVCICKKEKTVRILTKRVERPLPDEIAMNPMARSAKLRVVERV